MRLLPWKVGRTSPNNYYKLTLVSWWFFDCYILKFPKGSSIDWHVDLITQKAHHRLNFFLWKPKQGGQIMTKLLALDGERQGAQKLTLRRKTRLHYMRPDVTEHAVSEVKEGLGLILSVGWATKK